MNRKPKLVAISLLVGQDWESVSTRLVFPLKVIGEDVQQAF